MNKEKQNKFKSLSSQELKLLVLAAKAGEPQAITTICSKYEPLIMKLCSRPHIYNVLGYEDACNSCYVYLLELVIGYKGNNWQQLPGLIKLHIKRSLHAKYLKEQNYLGANQSLLEETTKESATTSLELEEVDFKAFLNNLPEKERLVTELLVYEGLQRYEIAERTGLSLRTIYNLRKKVLEKLL